MSTQATSTTNYWPDGEVQDQIDANGADTHYYYDLLDHLSGVTDPDGRTTTYQSDAEGNLLAKGQPGVNGCTHDSTAAGSTTYSYDWANELTGIRHHDPATPMSATTTTAMASESA